MTSATSMLERALESAKGSKRLSAPAAAALPAVVEPQPETPEEGPSYVVVPVEPSEVAEAPEADAAPAVEAPASEETVEPEVETPVSEAVEPGVVFGTAFRRTNGQPSVEVHPEVIPAVGGHGEVAAAGVAASMPDAAAGIASGSGATAGRIMLTVGVGIWFVVIIAALHDGLAGALLLAIGGVLVTLVLLLVALYVAYILIEKSE